MRALLILMLGALLVGCPNLPDPAQVGALTFETKLVLGCEPVEVAHEIPGPEVVEIARLLRPLDSTYENILKQGTLNGVLAYGGKLEPVSWARLKYFKPVYVVDLLGEKYVLDEDGALRFQALLKEYGKLPAEISLE
jgi:hypothetical protein